MRSPHEALAACWRGDFGPAERLVAHGRPAVHEAWDTAFAAHRWLAEPERGRLPDARSLVRWASAGDEALEAVHAACIALVRACVLAFDARSLHEVVGVHRSITSGAPADSPQALWRAASEGWWRLFHGPSHGDAAALEQASNRAAHGGIAPLVIELQALRALTALSIGDTDAATSLARRASRMARTEALPQQEYLAHLALARVRRMTGRPHFAIRIAAALRRVVPPPWHRWLDWEARLAGAREPSSPHGDSVAADAMLNAAQHGDAAAFAAAGERLLEGVGGWNDLRREAQALLEVVDPRAVSEDPLVLGWLDGRADHLPYGLDKAGLVEDAPEASRDAVGWVLCAPGHRGRRVLRPGIGLAGAVRLLDHDTTNPSRKQGRTHCAIAALALAGPEGLDEETFFRQVYGFAYSQRVHGGVLRVLLHRIRAQLEAVASVQRVDGRWHLQVDHPFAVPDPRTAAPVADRVLRILAAHPGMTAKDAARLLEVPLRTVQGELSKLVEDGSCSSERRGRRTEYRVDDTTFREPTRPSISE